MEWIKADYKGSTKQRVYLNLFYLVLAVVMTLPVIFHLQEQVPSFNRLTTFLDGDSDAWLFIWNLWWVDFALSSGSLKVMQTDYLYHPNDVSLLFHSYSLMNGVFAYVAGFFVSNRLIIYNLLFLLSFYLAGLTSFQLFTYVTRDWRAGLIGSLVFTLSPYHFLHSLEHLNLMSIQWLPLGIYFFLKFKNEGQKRFLVGGLAMVTINYFVSFYFAIMLLLFYVVFAVADFINSMWKNSSRAGKGELWRTVLYVIAASLVLISLVAPMWSTIESDDYTGISLDETSLYSADLLSFVVSNPLHPLWGKPARLFLERLPGNIIEKGVSHGIIPFILLIVALFCIPRRILFPWLICLLVFLVLSCGPFLFVNGKQLTILGKPIILPFLLFQSIDFLNHFRAPARFAVIAGLCLALINALVVTEMGRRWLDNGTNKTKTRYQLLLSTLFVLLITEFWSAPLPLLSGRVPHIYHTIAQETDHFVVLDVPLDYTIRKYQYYQTVHQHPIKMAFLARHPRELIQKTQRDPVLRYFMFYRRTQPFKRPTLDDFTRTLQSKKIKYLVLHRAYLAPERLTDMISFLAPFKDKVVSDKQNIIVYRFHH